MDDDLRQKLAPRRNKRYAHLRGFDEEARWGMAWIGKPTSMIFTGSPADFAKLVAEETEKWGKVVKFAGLKAD